MASGPMQKCCVTGTLHEGTPGGTVQTISNIPVYIAHPPSPSPYAILLFTDVLGFTFRNTRLVADAFASCGYLTVIPDLFRGAEITWPIATDFDLQAYMDSTMPRAGAVDPIIESTIAWLKSEMSVQRVGGVGYCFGGKYVCRWLKGGGVYAGFVAHPSFVEKEEVEGVRGALSIAAAEIDEIFTVEKRRETEDILAGLTVPWQIFLYSGVEHGFAVKGDLANERGRFAKEQAFAQAVGWFEEYLKKG